MTFDGYKFFLNKDMLIIFFIPRERFFSPNYSFRPFSEKSDKVICVVFIVSFSIQICNIVLSSESVLRTRSSGRKQSRRDLVYSWEGELRNALPNT